VTMDGFGLMIGLTEHLQKRNNKKLRQSHWFTHSKDHCNYSIHKVSLVLNSRCLVAASNGGCSASSGFPNCTRPQLPASHFSQLQLSADSTNLTEN
jgi:hypothetical protein